MKLSTSLLAALSFASVAMTSTISVPRSTACKASDRVPVSTHDVTSPDGHKIHISTAACSADIHHAPGGLAKRQVINVSSDGQHFGCVTGGGTGPTQSDCEVIINYLYSTYVTSDSQATFTVSPQYAQVLTYGTCEWAWINTEPVGGATLAYDYLSLYSIGFDVDGNCIVNSDTGGYVTPTFTGSQTVYDWEFEIFHS